MNTAVLLGGSIVYFALAYFFYGRFLNRLFGINPERICPSHTLADGTDYVASKPMVLFGHHFASIAGPGPIVGPILAVKYGWVPAILWILAGCVFVGAVHDFAAMFLSARNQGRSIAYVIEKELGYTGRQIFIIFCLAALILIITVLTAQIADSFIKNPAVATASILFIAMAPVFGLLSRNNCLSLVEASLIFVPLTFLTVWVGTLLPFDLCKLLRINAAQARFIWTIALLYYAFLASTLPVWFLLQPRDYLNSFLLYAMMLLGIGGIFAARQNLHIPEINLEGNAGFIPDVLPLLFVTIACGACSGFHAMVASGTSAKQIDNEKHLLPIAYGGMLLEGVLAIVAICSVGYLSSGELKALFASTNNAAPIMFAHGIGHFTESLGLSFHTGSTFIALAISAFILTTLDTATRLARFLLQELGMPRENASTEEELTLKHSFITQFISNRWDCTIVIILLSIFLVSTGESSNIWPVFGAANQLLAAMTLVGVTLYLVRHKKPFLFALLPTLFMLVIAIWALANLVIRNYASNWILFGLGCFLIVMAFFLGGLAIIKLLKKIK